MTRRESREAAFCIVFGMSISHFSADEAIDVSKEAGEPALDNFSKKLIESVFLNRSFIDEAIKPYLKGWNIERISKTSLSILRISCAQLFFWDKIIDPESGDSDELSESIIINEAVELAKKYGDDDDYMFVNGILGSVVRA